MKKIIVFCCLALLCACARQPVLETSPENRAVLEQRWQKFAAIGAVDKLDKAEPYRLQLSLRFGTEGDTRRVTALFWGNSQRQLRLDVMAGVGTTVAKILEDGQHFLVYSPSENKAYFYQGATKPLLQVGVPVPFNLVHLADLLNGRYAAVFGKQFEKTAFTADGKAVYDLQGQPGGRVTINEQGLTEWQEQPNGKGWSMEILYSEHPTPLPRRLNLAHSNGKCAIVLIKEREKVSQPFTKEQMALPLPEDAPLLPLAKFKQQQ